MASNGISWANSIVEEMPSFSTISGTVSVSQGGTGQTSFTANSILTGSGTTVSSVVIVPVANGGTGLASFTAGSIVTGSGATVSSVVIIPVANGGTGLASFTANSILTGSGGVVSSVTAIPSTQGGTGQSASFTQYGVAFASSTTALAITAAGTTSQVLSATTSAAPSWVSLGTAAFQSYTEGTFTTTLTLGGGTASLTDSTLKYIKIGNQVTITGRLIVNAVSTPSGSLTINGLPFTVFNSVTNLTVGSFMPLLWAVGLVTNTYIRAIINTTTALVYMQGATGGYVTTNVANNLANSCQMEIGLTYFTA